MSFEDKAMKGTEQFSNARPQISRAMRGNLLWQLFSQQADQLALSALGNVHTADEWNQQREGRREKFRRNLGLEPWPWPLPPPSTRACGEFAGPGYRAKKMGYELAPQCWGSGTVYFPDPLPEHPVPGILYTCGHTATGSHHFHPHPVLWARRGYACLIIDTIEQNDNPGEHHGFLAHLHHQRLALGISASGLEVFNSLRALDVLANEPGVDARRLGVTGVSGGGAMSFFVAACDERIQAVSTLCGLCSPRDALTNGHLPNHCDCMFPLGVEPMDTAEIAALIAPRAALFCFGRQDKIFHIEESARIAGQSKKIWEMLGVAERWGMVLADCPHGDHPAFDQATQQWFDLHLLGEDRPALERGKHEIDESVTCVFQGTPPRPNHLHLLPEILIPRGQVRLPMNSEEWISIRRQTIAALRQWAPPEVSAEFSEGTTWDTQGNKVTEYEGGMEGMGVLLRITTRSPNPEALLLSVATGGEAFQNVMPLISPLSRFPKVVSAILEPRLCGWNYPGVANPGYPSGTCFEFESRTAKAMSLFGLTPVALFLQDVLATIKYLHKVHGAIPIFLHGRGESAVAALLAALFEETIAGVVLEELPWSFADRSAMIGVLRVLDIPHAIGLLAPRPAVLINQGHGNWSWPTRAYRRLDRSSAFVLDTDFRNAMEILFAPPDC